MAYLPTEHPEMAADTAARTEFAQLRQPAASKAPQDPPPADFFVARPHQLFLARYMAPETPHKAVAVIFGTGTGKTSAALMAALPYITKHKATFAARVRALRARNKERGNTGHAAHGAARHAAAATAPTVSVVGFSETVFRAELASRPAFGVATAAELDELRRLRDIVRRAEDTRDGEGSGSTARRAMRNLLANMKRRMVDRLRGGFWRFFGYQELVNKMFMTLKVNLFDLAEEADRAGEPVSAAVARAEARGELRVNAGFLRSFAENFVIFDEVHHAYNSHHPNNWGVACRLMLELAGVARAMFLTATPAQARASEFVELANMIRAVEGQPPIPRKDVFLSKGEGARSRSVIVPGGLARIREVLRGRLLFWQPGRTNPLVFPEWAFKGTRFPAAPGSRSRTLSLEESAGVLVRLSRATPAQAAGYWRAMGAGRSPAMADAAAVRDASFPLPDGELVALNAQDFQKIGEAPRTWRGAQGLGYDKARGGLTGPALGDRRLGQMSAKLADMREYVRGLVKTRPGEKIMVYHPRVRGLGVETIANILASIGVAVLRDPARATPIEPLRFGREGRGSGLCAAHGARCNGREKICTRAQAVVLHSYLDPGALAHVLHTWNLPENAHGRSLLILVASEVLEEMHTLKSTRHQLVMALPSDIQSLRQLNGRLARDGSMAQLPPEERSVSFVVFATAFPPQARADGTAASKARRSYGADGWDLESWRLAFAEYGTIRRVEQALFREAPGAAQLEANAGLSAARLGPLPFMPADPAPAQRARPQTRTEMGAAPLGTYNAYGYAAETAGRYADGLRVLFARSGAWRTADLKAALAGAGADPAVAHSAAAPLLGGALRVLEYQWALGALMHSSWQSRGLEAAPGMTVVSRGDLLMLAPTVGGVPWIDEDAAASVVAGIRRASGHPVAERGFVPPIEHGVDVAWFARSVKSRYNFQVQRDSWLAEISALAERKLPARERIVEAAVRFSGFSDSFHYGMLRELLSPGSPGGPPRAAARALALAAYAAFGMLLSPAEARRQKGRAGFFRGGVAEIGGTHGGKWTWTVVPRGAVRRGVPPPKESRTIGLYEAAPGDGGLQFKLRTGGARARPRDGDKRTLERGTACTSRRKEELRAMVAEMRGKAGPVRGTTEDLCVEIKRMLLRRELEARAARPQRRRFFVMFHEE